MRAAGEINPLAEIPAKQAVGNCVDASLPRPVRIAKQTVTPVIADRRACCASSCSRSQIMERLLRIDPVAHGVEADDGSFSTGIVHLGQGHKRCGARNRCADDGCIASTLARIVLPMGGNDVRIDPRRSLMDAGRVGDGPLRSSPPARVLHRFQVSTNGDLYCGSTAAPPRCAALRQPLRASGQQPPLWGESGHL